MFRRVQSACMGTVYLLDLSTSAINGSAAITNTPSDSEALAVIGYGSSSNPLLWPLAALILRKYAVLSA